jgi:hypothetical protein
LTGLDLSTLNSQHHRRARARDQGAVHQLQGSGRSVRPPFSFDRKPYSSADKGIPEHTYQFTLDLFAPIVVDQTKKNLSSRYLQLILQKKDAQEEFWPRLTKEKVRLQWLKTDFSKVSSLPLPLSIGVCT